MRKGFTLLEILIVLGILIILGTISFLSLGNFRQNQALDLSAKEIVAFLRDAQSRAISQEGGLEWGVRFENSATGKDSYHLFSGPSFTSAQSTVSLPASLEFSDPAEGMAKNIVFQKIAGLPATSATIILRLVNNPSLIKIITINAQGTIEEN